MSTRLDELATMEDGWYWHGEGRAPTTRSLAVARSFDACFPGGHIYPTLEGGIQFEGDANGYAWSIRIGPRGGVTSVVSDLGPLLGLR